MTKRNTQKLTSHRGIDTCRITDVGPRVGIDDRETYPDFDDKRCWVITGTWGPHGTEVKGWSVYEEQRRFTTPSDARDFYTSVTGKSPVERGSWGFGPGKGGRWGLKFRGTRPDKIPLPPPLAPEAPETTEEVSQ